MRPKIRTCRPLRQRNAVPSRHARVIMDVLFDIQHIIFAVCIRFQKGLQLIERKGRLLVAGPGKQQTAHPEPSPVNKFFRDIQLLHIEAGIHRIRCIGPVQAGRGVSLRAPVPAVPDFYRVLLHIRRKVIRLVII